MKKLNVVDLFCGCGGLSQGFSMANYEVLLGIDIDKASLDTFKYNHPLSQTLEADLTKVSGRDITKLTAKEQIDVIIGGSPCQGFSLSGPRKFNDPRNSLYLSFIRIIKEIRPKAFLIENVPGIIGLYQGQIKKQIISGFADLGYKVAYQKLNAADYGVPQLRNRVFFVGLLDSNAFFDFPAPILTSNAYITSEASIGDLPSLETKTGTDPMPYPNNGKLTKYQKFCRKGATRIHNHIRTEHTEKTRRIVSLVPEGGNYKNLPKRYFNTRNFHVAWTRLHSKKPAPTIDTGHRHHFHYLYNRVPTVRECARLQSFPDTFIFLGNKSQQYQQVGNAVPSLLAKILAQKLKDLL